nr:zf-CCHC domain-containing protein/DUF4219 domain-containing protein/UBN2 domain-containing protein [Tanacetum cinerariifolium]
MQIPSLFEANGFISSKNRYETYVKFKDIDLWHIIVNGHYKPVFRSTNTDRNESVPYERQNDEHKKMLPKNNEKKAKLFNEWEMFTSNEGESIESYYHRFLKLMNDLKKNKHFPEKIASNLKFLNNLQPKWSQHVTIVHQSKDLHTADYTRLYDFLKYNQKEQASTSGTQTDSAPVYDTNGSAEVHENCDDNEIFNMFTQEEQYTELLEPIPESHKVPQNDNDVISEDTSMEQGGETVEQHPANFEKTRSLYESLYQNLAIEVEKVNSVNCKLKETNADL